jgi:hypothetical protein
VIRPALLACLLMLACACAERPAKVSRMTVAMTNEVICA